MNDSAEIGTVPATRRTWRHFTKEDDAAVCAMYEQFIPVRDIAFTLDRSEASIKQRIFHKLKIHRPFVAATKTLDRLPPEVVVELRRGDVEKFRAALTRYRTELEEIRRAQTAQRESARAARAEAIIAAVMAVPMTRNQQIAAKRIAGLRLEDLAQEYGITRERVRQICEAMVRGDEIAEPNGHDGAAA